MLVALLAAPTIAQAQAWVPDKGEGTVSVVFTNALSRDHFLPDERFDVGHISSNTLLFDVTYGLTERVAVSFGLPVVFSRYRGDFPHRPITLDDGRWHAAPQDFRFALRYNAVRGPVMFTPFVSTDLPSHDYEFYTHAAPGRRLKEIQTGIMVGKLFADAGVVIQGRYGHAFSERGLQTIPRRYSVVSLEAAWFLTPSLRLVGMSANRIGHTGIDIFLTSGRDLPFEVFYNHDRISRESYWNLGAGAAFSLNDRMDLYGAFTSTVAGRNTHAVNRGISIGVSWTFRKPGEGALSLQDARQDALVRCLCEKGGK